MITAIFCLIFYLCHRTHPQSIGRDVTELTMFGAGVIVDVVLEAIGIVYILSALGFV